MLLSAEWRTDPAKLVMEWATLPPDRHAYWALRLTDVRGFAHHVANLDPRTEVPPVGILPGWKRAKPYVYSDTEIDALLAAALALPPANGLRRWAGFRKLIAQIGERAAFPFPVHLHMLRHACGYKLANDGQDTRAVQHNLVRHGTLLQGFAMFCVSRRQGRTA